MKKSVLLYILGTVVVVVTAYVQTLPIRSGDIIPAQQWLNQYPDEYASYEKNLGMTDLTEDGAEPIDYLEKYPDLKVLYDGYSFSVDYKQARGHTNSLQDVIRTERSKPGASCLSCKTPDYIKMVEEFGSEIHAKDFEEVASNVTNSISCYDCHKNTPGQTIITREHLIVALESENKEYKAGDMICAQCHIEYYLHRETKEVILPWDNGRSVEEIEKTYDSNGYYDWIHPQTGSKLLKAQHPEFETYQGSLHSEIGLTCASCHMPELENNHGESYRSHTWTSPLNHPEQSCLQCHTESAAALTQRVKNIQVEIQQKASDVSSLMVTLVAELKVASDNSEYDQKMLESAREYHRKAQWRWDFIFSENSKGFHNPKLARETLDKAKMYTEEALKILSIQKKTLED